MEKDRMNTVMKENRKTGMALPEKRKGLRRICVLAVVCILSLFMPLGLRPAQAACCDASCCACIFAAAERLRQHMTDEYTQHRDWMTDEFFRKYILKAMMMMTEQLTTVAMQQMQVIGSMFDAKNQMETQRLFQQLQAQAHKDYHTSEGICEVSTGVRALAASDRKAQYNALALNRHAMQRQLMSGSVSAAVGSAGDTADRIAKFKSTYCDPSDNAMGLDSMCGTSGGAPERRSADVDYTRMVESPLTLDIDFLNGTATPDEEDIIALQKNLFGHKTFDPLPVSYMSQQDKQEKFMHYRSAMAKRSVAENSFDQIVGMKSEGSGGSTAFLAAILKELEIPDNEVHEILGKSRDSSGRILKPSYFAQMEMLTKRIYQNPDFYTNLYDKPANVARKGVALQAIGLMQDRDYFRSQLRSEMLMSVLLELEISKVAGSVQNASRDLTGKGLPSSN
ncbi:MAG: hypothetical protein H6862_04215 [Rhodospirillales bacterium]|nr:hypothetical protein [Rhodospirillales bacterium]